MPIPGAAPETARALETLAVEVAAPAATTPADATRTPSAAMALVFALAAWLVPGLGHLLLRRPARALGFSVAVVGLVMLGYGMRGDIFPPHSTDPFGTLGFLADLGSGSLYFLSHVLESAGPDISRAMGDYGTRVIASAGVVNILAVVDAYQTSRRRR